MNERAPQPPGRHYPREAGRVRSIRRSLLAFCAAALAVAIAAGVHTVAEAHSAGGAGSGSGAAAAVKGSSGSAKSGATGSGPVDAKLDARINRIIGANGDYRIGVALLDLSGGAVHEYGVKDGFVAASTAKVLAAEAYYHLAESGKASLDDPLGDYTAGFQLKEMIQQSDNDSWSLVMDAVGHSALQDYAASIGVDYDVESNTLTPAGMARVLGGLYSGELLDAEDTAELLSYMQDTNNESLIPAAVPAAVTVFHKYGLLEGELHDAAILEKDAAAYAFVVYTEGDDLTSAPQRTEIIHQLTAAVTDALF